MMTWLDTRKGVSQSRTESTFTILTYSSIRVYFTDKYTDYPLLGVMYAHARAMYTRPPFPQEKRPGIEATVELEPTQSRIPSAATSRAINRVFYGCRFLAAVSVASQWHYTNHKVLYNYKPLFSTVLHSYILNCSLLFSIVTYYIYNCSQFLQDSNQC